MMQSGSYRSAWSWVGAWTRSNLVTELLIAVLFCMAAAAAHSGFIGKWSLGEKADPLASNRFSAMELLDGTAHRPFVYRQLVPALVNVIDAHAPEALKDHVIRTVNPRRVYVKTTQAGLPDYAFRYRLIYLFTFGAFFASLVVLRRLALATGAEPTMALLAPIGLVLAMPYLQTMGGYFYDAFELAFMAGALLAAYRRRWWMVAVLVVLGTLNKESFLFFCLTLLPLARAHLPLKPALALTGAFVAVSAAVGAVVKHHYAANPGAPLENHVMENLRLYMMPWTYRQTEMTYGLPGPGGTYFLTLLVMLLMIARGWRYVAPALRQHLLVALAVNVPLFVLFCANGELRNLSMLFPALALFGAHALATSRPAPS